MVNPLLIIGNVLMYVGLLTLVLYMYTAFARCGDGEMLIMNTETGERVILPPESVAKLLDVASHRRED